MNDNNLNNGVPVEPTVPENPVTPVEPVAPVEPSAPVAPVEPAVPTEPVIPAEPVAPVQPVMPVEPVVPVQPVQPQVVPQPGVPPMQPQTGMPPVGNQPVQQPQQQKSGKGFYIIAAILIVAIIALVIILVVVLGKKDGNGGSTTTTVTGVSSTETTTLQSTTPVTSTIEFTTNPNTTTAARTTTSPSDPTPTPVGGNNGSITIGDVTYVLPSGYQAYNKGNGTTSIVNKTKKIELVTNYIKNATLSQFETAAKDEVTDFQKLGYNVVSGSAYSYGSRNYYLLIMSLDDDDEFGYVYGGTQVGNGIVEFMFRASMNTKFDDIMYDMTTIMNNARVASSFAAGEEGESSNTDLDAFDTRIFE